ncbi:CD36 family [Popillia japonica]|uniref:Sensory neuron membrane protein 2 n=1 Tax=Popillia japonica TaxID=7064 RepID=A0AAW1I785_POPJA
MLRGTDSTIYAPRVFGSTSEEDVTIVTFSSDICRKIVYTITDGSQFNGTYYLKATMGPENMKNEGENSCYCIKKTPDIFGRRDCFPRGFCDMGNCLKAPVVLSLPHMLWSEGPYRARIKGLRPRRKKHISYIVLDEITGTLLQSRKRMQYNIFLRPVDVVNTTKTFESAMLPFLWVEENFDLTNDIIAGVVSRYMKKVQYLYIICYTLIGVGTIGGSTLAVYLLFPRF